MTGSGRQDLISWCRSEAAIRIRKCMLDSQTLSLFSCLKLQSSLSFWCLSMMAAPLYAPDLLFPVSSSIKLLYHGFYYCCLFNKLGPNPWWPSIQEWGESPLMPFEKVRTESSAFGILKEWGKKELDVICFFFLKVIEGNRAKGVGWGILQQPHSSVAKSWVYDMTDSFKTLLVSWESCSQVDLLTSHRFLHKAGQSANNRHHQTTGRMLKGRNWSMMPHVWGVHILNSKRWNNWPRLLSK